MASTGVTTRRAENVRGLVRKYAQWTAEENETLRTMKLAGYSAVEIATRLGKLKGQINDRWRWMNRTADEKETRNFRTQEYRRAKRGPEDPARFIRQQAGSFSVPPEILAEREARLAVERTPSEIQMGDPPKGFSALQGRGWDAVRASYDTPRSKPTLATVPMTFQGED